MKATSYLGMKVSPITKASIDREAAKLDTTSTTLLLALFSLYEAGEIAGEKLGDFILERRARNKPKE